MQTTNKGQVYHTPYSTHDIAFSPIQDAAYSPIGQLDRICQSIVLQIEPNFIPEIPNSHTQCESFESIFAIPTVMSFREKCAFLDEVYNSYLDADLVSAKNLDAISKRYVVQSLRESKRLLMPVGLASLWKRS